MSDVHEQEFGFESSDPVSGSAKARRELVLIQGADRRRIFIQVASAWVATDGDGPVIRGERRGERRGGASLVDDLSQHGAGDDQA